MASESLHNISAGTRKLSRWAVPLGAVALGYLVLALFWPVAHFQFIRLDVPAHVIHNPHVHGLSWENLKYIFTRRGTTSSYYPVRSLSFAINYQLFGLDAGAFKLTNVLIHLGNVLLVYWLILRLFRRCGGPGRPAGAAGRAIVAVFAAALFAVHPLVVEPVAWVSGREELLMALGSLGCFHFHLSARRREEWFGGRAAPLGWRAAAAACCLTACLSSALGAVIPLLVTAWDVVALTAASRSGQAAGKTASPAASWSGLSAAVSTILRRNSALWIIGIVTVVVKLLGPQEDPIDRLMDAKQAAELSAVIQQLGYGSEFIVGEARGEKLERLMLVLNVYWLNLKSVFWPTRLAVCYKPVTARSFLETDVLLGGLLVVATGVVLWRLRRRPLALFGLLWFLLALSPAAQILPHHIHRADRFLYLPLAGLAVALAGEWVSAHRLWERRAVAAAALVAGAALLVGLELLASRQLRTWRDDISVWENCVRAAPDNVIAHRMLAISLVRNGQPERARPHFEYVVKQNVLHVKALTEFATFLATHDDPRQRDYPLAIRLAKWAGQLCQWKSPEVRHALAVCYNNYALALSAQGEFGRAIQYYRQALQTKPDYPTAALNLALLLATCPETSLRRPQQAIRLAEQGCQAMEQPDANSLMILAGCQLEAGKLADATATVQRAVAAAEKQGDPALAARLRQRLELLKQQPEKP